MAKQKHQKQRSIWSIILLIMTCVFIASLIMLSFVFSEIEKYFTPAIKNGLLKINYIELDDTEYESCFKTIK